MRLPAPRIAGIDAGAAGWLVAAALVSVGAGLLAAVQPMAAFDAAVVATCAVLIAWRPFAALLILVLVRGAAATTPSAALLDLLTLGAAGLAVLACARRVPGRRVTVPFLAFLLLALPWIPLLPSWDEGAKELYLKLPVVGVQYLRQPSNELLEFLRLAVALPVFVWAAWSVRTVKQLHAVIALTLASAVYP